jgi:hypothetical protein
MTLWRFALKLEQDGIFHFSFFIFHFSLKSRGSACAAGDQNGSRWGFASKVGEADE